MKKEDIIKTYEDTIKAYFLTVHDILYFYRMY